MPGGEGSSPSSLAISVLLQRQQQQQQQQQFPIQLQLPSPGPLLVSTSQERELIIHNATTTTTTTTRTPREHRKWQHQEAARNRILALHQQYPVLHLVDLLPWVTSKELTPAAVDNLLEARRYRYFHPSTNGGNKTKTSIPLSIPGLSADNSLLHFFSHIPKTGATYSIQQLQQFILQSPQYKNLFPSAEEGTNLILEGLFTSCDVALSRRYLKGRGDEPAQRGGGGGGGGGVCTLWMSEQRPPPTARNAYTLIRNPRHHVVSQYFHCKESTHHVRRAHYMPDTLEEWLQAWVNLAQMKNVHVAPKLGENAKFRCYDPRNMQTAFTRFDYPSIPHWKDYQDSIVGSHLPGTANPTAMVAATSLFIPPFDYKRAKQDLQARYKVIGLTERAAQSTCLIVIHYTGWVPTSCDCTEEQVLPNSHSTPPDSSYTKQTRRSMAIMTSSSRRSRRRLREVESFPPSTAPTNHSQQEQSVSSAATTPTTPIQPQAAPPPVLDVAVNRSNYDHGVQHHGDSFPLTPNERALIDQLTVWDAVLYQITQEIFAEQLATTEQEFGIRICKDLRSGVS